MNIVEQLKKDATDKGLCKLWQHKLSQELNTEELSGMFFQGIDFCIDKDFPTLDFMRANFKGKCEQYGIFIDDKRVYLENKENVALNGECEADLNYGDFAVARVFVRHNSKARVRVTGFACVTIDAYDKSDVSVIVSGTKAKVLVNVYTGAHVVSSGNAKVIIKNKEK